MKWYIKSNSSSNIVPVMFRKLNEYFSYPNYVALFLDDVDDNIVSGCIIRSDETGPIEVDTFKYSETEFNYFDICSKSKLLHKNDPIVSQLKSIVEQEYGFNVSVVSKTPSTIHKAEKILNAVNGIKLSSNTKNDLAIGDIISNKSGNYKGVVTNVWTSYNDRYIYVTYRIIKDSDSSWSGVGKMIYSTPINELYGMYIITSDNYSEEDIELLNGLK